MSLFDVYKEKVIDKVCIVPKMVDHSYGLSFMSNDIEKINLFICHWVNHKISESKNGLDIKYFFQTMNKIKAPYYCFIEVWNDDFEDQLFEIAEKISYLMGTTIEIED